MLIMPTRPGHELLYHFRCHRAKYHRTLDAKAECEVLMLNARGQAAATAPDVARLASASSAAGSCGLMNNAQSYPNRRSACANRWSAGGSDRGLVRCPSPPGLRFRHREGLRE